jgi:hypothetical protein
MRSQDAPRSVTHLRLLLLLALEELHFALVLFSCLAWGIVRKE